VLLGFINRGEQLCCRCDLSAKQDFNALSSSTMMPVMDVFSRS